MKHAYAQLDFVRAAGHTVVSPASSFTVEETAAVS